MAIIYTVSKTATTFAANYRATGPTLGIYTFTQRRAFLPFDLTGSGIVADSLSTAQLIIRVTAVVGGSAPLQMLTAVNPDGFGATLDATNADWKSTTTNIEQTHVVNATGVWTWDIDPSHINVNGVTYIRIWNLDEGAGAPFQTGATFNSVNAGTPSNRPVLRLTFFSGEEKMLAPAVGTTEKMITFTAGTKKVLLT